MCLAGEMCLFGLWCDSVHGLWLDQHTFLVFVETQWLYHYWMHVRHFLLDLLYLPRSVSWLLRRHQLSMKSSPRVRCTFVSVDLMNC